MQIYDYKSHNTHTFGVPVKIPLKSDSVLVHILQRAVWSSQSQPFVWALVQRSVECGEGRQGDMIAGGARERGLSSSQIKRRVELASITLLIGLHCFPSWGIVSEQKCASWHRGHRYPPPTISFSLSVLPTLQAWFCIGFLALPPCLLLFPSLFHPMYTWHICICPSSYIHLNLLLCFASLNVFLQVSIYLNPLPCLHSPLSFLF